MVAEPHHAAGTREACQPLTSASISNNPRTMAREVTWETGTSA
jgi:hypothetical protein